MILTEQVFRKMGYKLVKGKGSKYYYWVDATGLEANFMDNTICDTENGATRKLPPIDSQWEITADYLVPFMQEKGYRYQIEPACYSSKSPYAIHFQWGKIKSDGLWDTQFGFIAEDTHIAEAACKSFMEVKL